MHHTNPLGQSVSLRHGLSALSLLLMFSAVQLTGLAPSAHAQDTEVLATSTDQVKFPAGLKWEPMREVRFQDPSKPGVKSLSKDHEVAQAVWADEVKRSFEQAPAFSVGVLLAQARSARNTVLTFSLLNVMDFDRCEPPLNGKDIVDMYSKCLARVHVGHTPQPVMKEFAGFCYLHIDTNPATPLTKNHTEFAFDPRTGTGYFRVIQYGKEVPACRRSIRLEGV
jgi:hypothetical protein